VIEYFENSALPPTSPCNAISSGKVRRSNKVGLARCPSTQRQNTAGKLGVGFKENCNHRQTPVAGLPGKKMAAPTSASRRTPACNECQPSPNPGCDQRHSSQQPCRSAKVRPSDDITGEKPAKQRAITCLKRLSAPVQQALVARKRRAPAARISDPARHARGAKRGANAKRLRSSTAGSREG
jgi:hypothetical protein